MGQYELFENRINSFKYEWTIVVGNDNSSVETEFIIVHMSKGIFDGVKLGHCINKECL